jgi:hypothetical protein
VRTGNGEVNLPSLLTGFGNNPGRYKTAGEDELMRELVTMRELQRKLTPDSGTAARVLANLPREAMNAANKPFTWGVAGAIGASQLFGNK